MENDLYNILVEKELKIMELKQELDFYKNKAIDLLNSDSLRQSGILANKPAYINPCMRVCR